MQHANLGASGLKVSRLCLGCMSFGDPSDPARTWVLAEEASKPFFKQALEAGINFFDTALFHGRERRDHRKSHFVSITKKGRARFKYMTDQFLAAEEMFTPHFNADEIARATDVPRRARAVGGVSKNENGRRS